jgi:hypothetical protein
VDPREQIVAAQDVGAPARVTGARGERRAARATDRLIQRQVVGGARRGLRELHVVDDRARAGPPQAIDGLRVAQAPEGPHAELGDAALVDPDDHDVRDRGRATQAEASVHARVLQRRERAAQPRRRGDNRRGDAGQQPTGGVPPHRPRPRQRAP